MLPFSGSNLRGKPACRCSTQQAALPVRHDQKPVLHSSGILACNGAKTFDGLVKETLDAGVHLVGLLAQLIDVQAPASLLMQVVG